MSKTQIYIVRHCQALGNVTGHFQGHTDGDISDVGRHQLELLCRRFDGVHIDRIYSSPLKRAWLTAEAVAQGSGCSDIITDCRLIEINGGNLENHTVDEMKKIDHEQTANWFEHFELFSPSGGESTAEVYRRMLDAVTNIAENNPDRTVAISSHGCAIRCFLCAASKLPLGEIDKIGFVANTSVSKLIYEHGSFTTDYLNDTEHFDSQLRSLAVKPWYIKDDN